MPMFTPDDREKQEAADWLDGTGVWVLLGIAAALFVMGVLVVSGVVA